MHNSADLIVIGAGAAGLMAAIWGKRAAPERDVLLLDRASRLGAKILISGGGRCNVTHFEVQPTDYAGSSQSAVKQILHQFTVEQTCAFFNEFGIRLKKEATGKLFPETDQAQTVLNALLKEVRTRNIHLEHPVRVRRVEASSQGFTVETNRATFSARRVVIACGGKSFPKTGSDGSGYAWVRQLGHSLTENITPALVPLTLPKQHFLRRLSGLSADVELELRSVTGKRLRIFEGPLLCTHFGVSGPVVLDCSRYWIEAQRAETGYGLYVRWTPGVSAEAWEQTLQTAGHKQAGSVLKPCLPERLGRALCESADVDPLKACDQLSRDQRKRLVRNLTAMPLPVTGDRGFEYAEVTAGGVPLSELKLKTMESRVCPGLYLCGEICDVDGRIGGFNFQWAWSSGVVAGRSAAEALRRE